MAHQELPHQQYEIPTGAQERPVAPVSNLDLIRAGLDIVLENNGHGRILSLERPLSPEAQASRRIKREDDEVRAIRNAELQEAA